MLINKHDYAIQVINKGFLIQSYMLIQNAHDFRYYRVLSCLIISNIQFDPDELYQKGGKTRKKF